MRLTKKQREHCFEMGKNAFEAGKPPYPVNDKIFEKYSGQFPDWTIGGKLAKYWMQGWHIANLNQPIN